MIPSNSYIKISLLENCLSLSLLFVSAQIILYLLIDNFDII